LESLFHLHHIDLQSGVNDGHSSHPTEQDVHSCLPLLMDFEFVQHLHGIELIYPPNKLPNSPQSITMNLILQKKNTKKEASKGLNIT
jgi:hypothetical protein